MNFVSCVPMHNELKRLLCRFDIIDEAVLSPSSAMPSTNTPDLKTGEKLKRQFVGASPARVSGYYAVMYSYPQSDEDGGITEFNRRGTFSVPAPVIKSLKLHQALPGNYLGEGIYIYIYIC